MVIIIGIIISLYNRSVSEDYIDTTKSSSPAYNQDQILSETLGCIDEETYSAVSNCMLKKDFDTIKKYMALGTVVTSTWLLRWRFLRSCKSDTRKAHSYRMRPSSS